MSFKIFVRLISVLLGVSVSSFSVAALAQSTAPTYTCVGGPVCNTDDPSYWEQDPDTRPPQECSYRPVGCTAAPGSNPYNPAIDPQTGRVGVSSPQNLENNPASIIQNYPNAISQICGSIPASSMPANFDCQAFGATITAGLSNSNITAGIMGSINTNTLSGAGGGGSTGGVGGTGGAGSSSGRPGGTGSGAGGCDPSSSGVPSMRSNCIAEAACDLKPRCGAQPTEEEQDSTQDNRYKNICFKGSIKPRPALADESDVAEVTNNLVDPQTGKEKDLDAGVDGAKAKDCILHKSTPNVSTLSLNGGWLLLENDTDTPSSGAFNELGDPEYVFGTSFLYKESNNQHKYKGAYINGFGGLNNTTFPSANEGCSFIQPLCGKPYQNPQQLNRVQLDACTNQYIFKLLSGKGGKEGLNFIFDPKGQRDSATIDQTFCQPLKMIEPLCEPPSYSSSGSRPSDSCAQKKCRRLGGCNGRLTADRYDYEAWRYIAQGAFRVLTLNYMPAYWGSIPNYPNEAEVTRLVEQYKSTSKFGGTKLDQEWRKFGDGMAADSWGGTDIQLPDLMKHPYERIWDPSHPFSPRYDIAGVDRNMSKLTAAYAKYGTCTVACSAVPVDVMSFRADKFNRCMGCRIAVNTSCFQQDVIGKAFALAAARGSLFPTPADYKQAFTLTASGSLSPMPGCATVLMQADKWPPCSTRFDETTDKVPPMCQACVVMSGDLSANGGINRCCRDLAKPLVPINTLKIRTKDKVEPAEGLEFKTYFGNHKPYMRWWDTGGEAGTPGSDDQWCDLGKKDYIVGVGNEKRACRYGGAGSERNAACFNIPKPDPITDWMELKLYQINTFRTFRLNCLGQYEKLFKGNAAEDFTLLGMTKPATPNNSFGRPTDRAWPESWRGYITDPEQKNRFPHLYKQNGFSDAISGPYGNLPKGLDNAKVGDVLIWDEKLTPGRVPHVALVTKTNLLRDNPKLDKRSESVTIIEMNAGKYPDACGTTDGWGSSPERTLYKNCVTFNLDNPQVPDKFDASKMVWANVYEPFIRKGTVISSPAGVCYVGKIFKLIPLEGTWECKDVNLAHCLETDWSKIGLYRPCSNPETKDKDCRDR